MLPQYASMYGWWKSSLMFENVAWSALSWNAPSMTAPAGTNRNAIVYAKNGRVATQAREKRFRPDTMSGRSASGAACAAIGALPDLRRPLGRDLRLRIGLLREARELHLRVDRRRRQRRQQGLRDHLALR